jgi:hypothetical protein
MYHVWGEMCLQGFGGETLRERDYLKDPGIDGRIILSWIFMKFDGGTDWIDLVRDWYRFQAPLITVMNLLFP